MRALALVLTALSAPVAAQPVLDRTGKRLPAGKAELLFAARVTRAAELELEGTSRLEQPAGEPRKLAGRVLRGAGERVDETGLSIRRLRFGSPAEAAVAAELLGRGARVDPEQPRCVTQALGPKATPELLAQVERTAKGAALVGRKGRPDACALRVPRPALRFTGAEVRLRGLAVLRLRFGSTTDAGAFVARRVDDLRADHVLDQVGAEVVVLHGAALRRPGVGVKALAAVWKAGGPGKGKRGSLGVWIARDRFALFTAEGALYRRAAELLRGCRRSPRGITPGKRAWRFTDPRTRNDLRLRPTPARPDARHGGVLATTAGLVHVQSERPGAPERARLLALLRAVGVALPAKAAQRVPLRR